MDSTCRTKTVQAICKQIDNNQISFKHKLQRPEGQWNRKMQTDLIDSLIRKMPINPAYGEKKDGTTSIIDGVQRLSSVHDFVNNKYALDKNMAPITINGETKELGGLKFKKLDEDTKDAILNAEMQIYEMRDCTAEEINELFRRQNAGKPLNQKLLRIVIETPEFSDMIYEMIDHPFMKKIVTSAQHKNGTDRDLIIQTFMLILSENGKDYTSFRARDLDTFVLENNAESIQRAGILREALDKFDEAFTEDKVKIPVTSVAMILFSGYKIIRNHRSFEKLVEQIKSFMSSYDTNAEYKKYLEKGTSSSENVTGRLEYWKGVIKQC